MSLTYTKHQTVSLKQSTEFNEKWVQQRIMDDPAMLGLGDVDLIAAEKVQPKAGRLDLLLHDDQLNRRYEVELMLGSTDPSHIMRCIEYWDIERRRYPAYDHVAVLVAEDITSRFLNVMSLLAGSIPLIAIQLVAIRIDDKIVLHCVQVLDQTQLRTDDEYEGSGGGGDGVVETDRAYWEKRSSEAMLALADRLLAMVNKHATSPKTFRYRKRLISVVGQGESIGYVWFQPIKNAVHLGGYVANPEAWVSRLEDAGMSAALKRGNKAARVKIQPTDLDQQADLIQEFIDAVADASDDD